VHEYCINTSRQTYREILCLIFFSSNKKTHVHVRIALSKQSGQLSISTCAESFWDNFFGLLKCMGGKNYISI